MLTSTVKDADVKCEPIIIYLRMGSHLRVSHWSLPVSTWFQMQNLTQNPLQTNPCQLCCSNQIEMSQLSEMWSSDESLQIIQHLVI